MREIVDHVDKLFAEHIMNRKNSELREEIISNLEAKVKDYTGRGMEQKEAVGMAVRDLGSIESLIDGNREIYIYRYMNEALQIALLYLVIAWVATIPLLLTPDGAGVNGMLLAASTGAALFYIIRLRKKDEQIISRTAFIDAERLRIMGKALWVIWVVYVLGYTIFTTALNFGSNIWFSRPIRISGPYQFAIMAVRYIKPFISIIIPLVFDRALKLIESYGVRD